MNYNIQKGNYDMSDIFYVKDINGKLFRLSF